TCRWTAVHITLARMYWVWMPRAERLPPHTLRSSESCCRGGGADAHVRLTTHDSELMTLPKQPIQPTLSLFPCAGCHKLQPRLRVGGGHHTSESLGLVVPLVKNEILRPELSIGVERFV